MSIRKFTVAAVACSLIAACGDSENNTNGDPNLNNGSNNTTANNTSPNNTTSTNNATNNGGTNNPTNNVTNNPTNNQTTAMGPAFAGLAASSDFLTSMSAWHAVTVDGDTVDVTTTSFGTGDLAVSAGQKFAYVMDRNGAQVQVLDKANDLADLGIIDVSGVATTNPQFATDSSGKVYISLYNTGEIAVATPSGANWDVVRLDTSAFDTFDGNPEASAMLSDGPYVMTVLQRLQDFAGVESSWLLFIDSRDDTIVDSDPNVDGVQGLDLGYTNVQGLRRVDSDTFAFGATGDYGATDGAVVLVEGTGPGEYEVGDVVVTEADLGGDLLDFVFVGPTTLYAVITLPDFSSKLMKVTDGVVTAVAGIESPGFGGLDAVLDGEQVVVGDRGAANGFGVLFSADDSVNATLSTDLPPASFAAIVCDADLGCGL